MRLVYFVDEHGNPLAVVAEKITALQQARTPTEYPSIVHVQSAENFRVRTSFDECQKRLMAALKDLP